MGFTLLQKVCEYNTIYYLTATVVKTFAIQTLFVTFCYAKIE